MYDLIPLFTLIIGLAGVLVIIGRKIPSLAALDAAEEPLIPPKVRIFAAASYARVRQRLNADKIQAVLLAALEKFLRRFRILTLKVDNNTSSWLKKIREKSLGEKPGMKWSVLKKEEPPADAAAAEGEQAEDKLAERPRRTV